MSIVNSVVEWTKATFEPWGGYGLFALAFMEASFFPIPPDVLIIALTLVSPDKWFLYAVIAALGSVMGAVLGYYIGLKGGLPLLKKLVSEDKIQKVHSYFDRFEAWAIFIAGFTPIPYKVFTIAAGVFYVDKKGFVIASVISRFARFFMVALIVKMFGPPMLEIVDRYFMIFTAVGLILLSAGLFVYFRFFRNKKNKKK